MIDRYLNYASGLVDFTAERTTRSTQILLLDRAERGGAVEVF